MGKKKRARQAAIELAERHEFTSGGLLGHDSTDYQVNVNERTALGIDAVHACVTRLQDAIGGGEVREMRRDEVLDPPHPLVRAPMLPERMTRREWLKFLVGCLALYNAVYLRRSGERFDGSPMSLEPIVPTRLSRVRPGEILLDGRETLRPDELVRIRRAVWPTVTEEVGSIIKLAREIFAAAWAQSAYTADFWESGGAPKLVLTSDQPLTNDDADAIRNRWDESRRNNPGSPAVLGKGAKAAPFGADLTTEGDPRGELIASIARFMGMQPWLVNAPSAAGSMVYQNSENAGLDLVRYTLDGYIGPIEDAWSMQLPGDLIVGRVVDIDVSHLTLGTQLQQFQAYQIATGNKPFMTVEEVRTRLRLPRDAGILEGAPAPAIEQIGVMA